MATLIPFTVCLDVQMPLVQGQPPVGVGPGYRPPPTYVQPNPYAPYPPQYPGDCPPGQQRHHPGSHGRVDLPIVLAAQFTHRADFRFEETGSGTKTVDLGSLSTGGTGAKLVLVSIDADPSSAAQPVMVAMATSSSPTPIEVSPGGFICLASPKPTSAGVLFLSLTWTSSFHGYVWVLG